MITNLDFSKRISDVHKAARLFEEGDHWQSGEAFILYRLTTDAQKRLEMERSFNSENIIGELVDNEQNAALGREPDWSVNFPIVKKDEIVPDFVDVAAEAAVSYWNDYASVGTLKEMNRIASTQATSFIRGYVPKGALSDNNRKENLVSIPHWFN
jgi:hypothetical protein